MDIPSKLQREIKKQTKTLNKQLLNTEIDGSYDTNLTDKNKLIKYLKADSNKESQKILKKYEKTKHQLKQE